MADVLNILDTFNVPAKSVVVPGDIADGVDGEIITWDATGVATTVGPGAATQVLTSNGPGTAPSFQAGGAGATTFLALTDTPGAYTDKAGQVALVNSAKSALEFLRGIESGKGIFANGQWGYWSADTAAASLSRVGLIANVQVTDSSSSQSETIDGPLLTQNTAASIGSDAHVRQTSSGTVRLDQKPLLIFKLKPLSLTTSIRFFAGLGPSNAAAADTIASSAVGVQYSTNQGDSNWQFIANDGGVQTTVDSGVAVDTAVHYVKIDATSGTSVTVSILDSNFVEQASTTFTTELYSATQSRLVFSGIQALAASVRSIDQFYATILNRI